MEKHHTSQSIWWQAKWYGPTFCIIGWENLPFFFTRVYSPLAQTDYCFLADKGDNKQHRVLPLHLTPPPSIHPSIYPTCLPPTYSTSWFLIQHAHTLPLQQSTKQARLICVCLTYLHLCFCLHFERGWCASCRVCMDMHAVQASSVTVPCHKTENINMLSLQQGASHQGNNSARRTLSQPKHIVWNATAKQVVENTAVVNTKLKGEFTLTVLWVI